MKAQHSSKSVEWYTPDSVIDACRAWGGGRIDLDPCSCAEAQARVQASGFYSASDNGLALPWFANTVLCNPPGGKIGKRSAASVWFDHAVHQWAAGRARRILFVGFSLSILRTSQISEQRASPVAYSALSFPICVPKERLHFVGGESESDHPSHDNVLIGICSGDDAITFRECFRHLGAVR